MMRKLFVGLTFWLSLVATAQASDAEGKFAVDGIGDRPCADFSKAVADKSALLTAFGGWTGGFLTGINVLRADTYDVTPFQPMEMILGQMASYCEQAPTERYVNALGKLVTVLLPDRLAVASPLVRVENNGKATFIYAAVLENVRARLTEQGFAAPGEGGTFTEAFAAALIAYQKANKLPQSGLPDIQTLVLLKP